MLFVEIARFNDIAPCAAPTQALELLNALFWALDELTEASGLLKVGEEMSRSTRSSGPGDCRMMIGDVLVHRNC